MSWEPGNPKGWGDPGPIVLVVLVLILAGAAVGNYNNYSATQQRCNELLQQGGARQ